MRNESQRKAHRNELLVEYKDTNQNLTWREVAEVFNITRQRAHQIYHNEKRRNK
jgi:DNA-directed RNA polymerase sigma subunit (sigma70/sigma32)